MQFSHSLLKFLKDFRCTQFIRWRIPHFGTNKSCRFQANSRHLARKYARIFVRVHYLFREANSFPRLEENCELPGTDNVQGQISAHIFAPNGDYLTIILRARVGYEMIDSQRQSTRRSRVEYRSQKTRASSLIVLV